ncbi:MAG: LysR family transcriptional regulator [Eggerthellaceae bacterium]
MNLSQLRYFRKLAEVQHFTRAAERLYITQPALSNSIKQLENELGVPLFEQYGRNVRLTKYGREFNEYVSEGLDVIDKGIQIAQEHANSLSGTIDIGTIFTVQSDYLPALLRTYRGIYGTQVDVRLYQGLTQGLLEKLEDGTYDVAICAYADNCPDIEFIPVLTQDLVAVLHEDNPLAQQEYISLDDLGKTKIVTYRPETSIGSEVRNLTSDLDLDIKQWCDDEITLGGEVAVNPDLLGLSLDTLGLSPFPQLKRVPFENNAGRGAHQVYLAYRKNAHKTRAVENMIALAEHMEWDGVQSYVDKAFLVEE